MQAEALRQTARVALLCLLLLCCAACAKRAAPPPEEADAPLAAEPTGVRGAYPSRLPPMETTPVPLSPPQPADVSPDELDDYSSTPVLIIADPLEGWNRFWFGFNDSLYSYFFRPLYRAYAFVTPEELRSGLKNALANALFPVRFINSILQGRFKAAGVEFGRFIVNSTLGVGGLFDVTKGRKTIVEVDADGADFGQTLGVWGVGPGTYLVWPVIGPSSVRDTVGRAADWFCDPLLFVPGTATVNWITAGVWGGLRFNAVDDTLDTYDNMKKAAVDPYLAMRDLYTRYRQGRVEKRYADYSADWNKPDAE